MLEWYKLKNSFPPILLLRRYTKLVARYCESHGMLDTALSDVMSHGLPFRIELLPYAFPDLSSVVLWVPMQAPECTDATGKT